MCFLCLLVLTHVYELATRNNSVSLDCAMQCVLELLILTLSCNVDNLITLKTTTVMAIGTVAPVV